MNSIVRPQHFTVDSLKSVQQNKRCQSKKQNEGPKEKVAFPSGNILPQRIRLFFTPLLINVPIEDFDPFYAKMEVSFELVQLCLVDGHSN